MESNTGWKGIVVGIVIVITFLLFTMIIGTCTVKNNCYETCLDRLVVHTVDCDNCSVVCKDISVVPW